MSEGSIDQYGQTKAITGLKRWVKTDINHHRWIYSHNSNENMTQTRMGHYG